MKHFIITACVTVLSFTTMQGQEDNNEPPTKEQLHIKIKENAQPDIYVDGKKFDFPMELIDVNRIESVNVLKGDTAFKKYKTNNGVVLITTKKIVKETSGNLVQFESDDTEKNVPVIFIDGERSNQKTLKKLALMI